MAHFAKIADNNEVITVEVVSNDIATTEQAGIDFQNSFHGKVENWKQTSYNTFGGVHKLGGTPFRKNYAEIGGTYDAERDAFIPRHRYPSWILDESTCRYNPPTPRPRDGNWYEWDEETTSWVRNIIT
jgi:hypothetical protein